jgi:ABC-2 type transport system ATP-binding protein
VSRLAIVDKGRVVASGTPDELRGRLRGDAVRIDLGFVPDGAGELVRDALAEIPGVSDVALDGRELSARADDGPAVAPAALAALDRLGVQVAAVTVARPSLDDVYLRYAGRRFAEADAAAAETPTLATVGGAR